MRLSAAWKKTLEARGHKVAAITSKMHNVRTSTADGIMHPSKRQAERWMHLNLLLRGKRIRNLKREVRYPIEIKGVQVCMYVADHVYEEREGGVWTLVIEDVKGMRTPIYKLKKRLMRAYYGTEIREV